MFSKLSDLCEKPRFLHLLIGECDRRAEAEVNWTALTLIMFIVFVHRVKIAT